MAQVSNTCGLPPLVEKNFCNNCGVETNVKQIICIKCGVSLSANSKSDNQVSVNLRVEYSGFYRSTDDKILFGFCGGLAHKFQMKSSMVRVLTLISGFFIIGWLYFLGIFFHSHPTKNS
jgi:phage shock protein PspC (stress-responsive transcriptional regulator)